MSRVSLAFSLDPIAFGGLHPQILTKALGCAFTDGALIHPETSRLQPFPKMNAFETVSGAVSCSGPRICYLLSLH